MGQGVRSLLTVIFLAPAMLVAWLDNIQIPLWIMGPICLFQLVAWIWIWLREGNKSDRRILTTLCVLACIILVGLLNPSHKPESNSQIASDPYLQIEPERFKPNPSHIAALPGTVDREKTLKVALKVLYAVSLCGILFALIKKQPAFIESACWLILIHGIIVSLVAIFFKSIGSELLLGRFETINPRFYGPFCYNNYWVGWYILTVSASLGIFFTAIRARSYSKLLLCLSGLSILFFSAYISGSRSAILASSVLVIYAVLEGLLWVLSKYKLIKPKLNLVKLGIYGIISGLCLFVATVILVTSTWDTWATEEFAEKQSGRLKDTIKQVSLLREGHLPDLRPAMARDGVKMALAKPIWGWGLGSYEYAFPAFAGPEFMDNRYHRQTNNFGKLIHPRYAHNDWVQYWAELGTIGYLAFLWSIFLFIRPGLQQIAWIKAFSFTRPLLAGIATLAVMALWDFPLYNLSVISLLAVILALFAACPASSSPDTKKGAS